MDAAVNRINAGVWIGDSSSAAQRIRGAATVRLRVKPESSNGTVIAYLYDVDGWGTGNLIAQAPFSWRTGANVQHDIDIRLPAVSYDVPSGHRLALVVDGADGYYLDDNGPFDTIVFSGPSWVDVPLR
jgi:predicted acyl esterase